MTGTLHTLFCSVLVLSKTKSAFENDTKHIYSKMSRCYNQLKELCSRRAIEKFPENIEQPGRKAEQSGQKEA